LLLILDLVLVAGAAIFLFLVIIRRGRIATNLGLALLLIVLAATVWYTSNPNTAPAFREYHRHRCSRAMRSG